MSVGDINPAVLSKIVNGEIVMAKQEVAFKIILTKAGADRINFKCGWFLAGTDTPVTSELLEDFIQGEDGTLTVEPAMDSSHRPFVLADILQFASKAGKRINRRWVRNEQV